MTTTQKIKISFVIEVDVQAYATEFGVTKTEAVKMIKGLVQDAGTAELINNNFMKQPGA